MSINKPYIGVFKSIRGLCLMGLVLSLSCTQNEPYTPREGEGTLSLFLNPIRLDYLLPGSLFRVSGQGLISEATYQVSLDLNQSTGIIRIPLELLEVQDSLLVRWPVEQALSTAIGPALGSILVEASLRGFTGSARTEWSADLQHILTPELTQLSPLVSPQTPSLVQGTGFLSDGEGTSILNLSGQFTNANGQSQPVELSEALTSEPNGSDNVGRNQRRWLPHPRDFGIEGGAFEGTASVTNNGVGGLRISESLPVRFELSEPFISFISPSSVSRGQRLIIEGGGLINEDSGFTILNFNGTLTPSNPVQAPIEYEDLQLSVRHENGARLSSTFEPEFNSSCESLDIGGIPGALDGYLSANVVWGNQEVVTTPYPISIEIAPSKQVVYVSFLPAFTDSLRLFGLRNLSARVIDEILAVVQRDYAGVNLELRTTPPDDFELYSIVEIGGPDPNAQSLFGLDNTTGLDFCNQRLNDNLAGRNAESGNSYGGVFVESFLSLSPSLNEDPGSLADPLFDEVFLPLMNAPAQQSDLEGPRVEMVLKGIRMLGHLVGNTLTHEIGHSLGLPVVPGCGSYHNADGPRQIMDCGRDRPFIERAGLDPTGPPQWTVENFEYLQKILPL
ncbi:MAG: hypothetical protein CMH49_07745 [Myxococcales bacterium]|nr:hypothetical protein [Myxococcales bacterium]